ncbi:MAG: formylglycine-generating enzyme family protein [Planctomycetota bacterium]|nr:formylglycine-generating enzyme family protein [Planctomycetota bacterium]
MHYPRVILPALIVALASISRAQSVGSSFCSPTNNSTGSAAILDASVGNGLGSNLHLEVTQGVPGEIGFFLVGSAASPGVLVSDGMLCLVGSGTSARFGYNTSGGSNSMGLFDSAGTLQNIAGTSTVGSGFDVPDSIPGSVPITIISGDTWHFQLWYRDTPSAPGSSNFTNGVSVTFPTVVTPTPIPGMVLIPPGTFDMGSNAAPGAPYLGDISTQPVHSVTISRSFWMGETEVTQAQFQAVMGTNPSSFPGPNRPVERVSWNGARAFCAALTAQELAAGNLLPGMEYRLPTEAEWEYACRAGSQTEFHFGTDLVCSDARFNFSYHSNSGCASNASTVVGSYPPNAFGLHDMHGNLWEWCLDTYDQYPGAAQTDPLVSGNSSYRIVRGGDSLNSSAHCRSAFRLSIPTFPARTVGFRVVLGAILVP